MARNRNRRNRSASPPQPEPTSPDQADDDPGVLHAPGTGYALPSPEEILELATQSKNYWQPCHTRQEQEARFLANVWGEQPQSELGLVADDTIPGSQELGIQFDKHKAILAYGQRIARINPAYPGHAPLIRKARPAMAYNERQICKRYERRGHGRFYTEEAHMALLRGWITQRVDLDEEALLKGRPPIEVQLADPITVSPVYGPAGLEWVVQEYAATKGDLLEYLPELETVENDELQKAEPLDTLTLLAVYGRWCDYYFVNEQHVRTDEHNLGFVRWIIIAVGGNRLATGMVSTSTQSGINSLSVVGAGFNTSTGNLNTTRDVGFSCFYRLIHPTRELIRVVSMETTALENAVLPRTKVKAQEPAEIDVKLNPGETTLIPSTDPNADVEPLAPINALPDSTYLTQYFKDQISRAGLPNAAWGLPTPGIETALERQATIASMLDTLKPWGDGECQAQEVRWDLTGKLIAARGMNDMTPETPGFHFLPEQTQPTGAYGELQWETLTAEEFQQLEDADVSVEFRELVPGEFATKVTTANMAKQSDVVSTRTIHEDKRFLGSEDPDREMRRLAVQKAEEQPIINTIRTLQAIAVEEPQEMAFAGPILEIYQQNFVAQLKLQTEQLELQQMQAAKAKADLLSMMQMQAAGVMPPGMPGPGGPPSGPGGRPSPSPGAPSPNGAGGAPATGPVGAPPGGGMQAGGPMGMPPGQQQAAMAGAAAAPPPQPMNVPGMRAAMNGQPAMVGGTQPGQPTSAVPPAALGQNTQPIPQNAEAYRVWEELMRRVQGG